MYARVGLRNETLRFNCAYTATARCSFNVRKRKNIEAVSKWTRINRMHLARVQDVLSIHLFLIGFYSRLHEIQNKKSRQNYNLFL